MCAWTCRRAAEARAGRRASDQSFLICARCEKCPRVQCVMEAECGEEEGEPNLKDCHDRSWKRVKVGGSVIFKDEPRGEEDGESKHGQPRRRKMLSYFHFLCASIAHGVMRNISEAFALYSTGSALLAKV